MQPATTGRFWIVANDVWVEVPEAQLLLNFTDDGKGGTNITPYPFDQKRLDQVEELGVHAANLIAKFVMLTLVDSPSWIALLKKRFSDATIMVPLHPECAPHRPLEVEVVQWARDVKPLLDPYLQTSTRLLLTDEVLVNLKMAL